MHASTHAHTHARTHARTHLHTHMLFVLYAIYCSYKPSPAFFTVKSLTLLTAIRLFVFFCSAGCLWIYWGGGSLPMIWFCPIGLSLGDLSNYFFKKQIRFYCSSFFSRCFGLSTIDNLLRCFDICSFLSLDLPGEGQLHPMLASPCLGYYRINTGNLSILNVIIKLIKYLNFMTITLHSVIS